MDEKRILIVDDEAHIIKSLSRLFMDTDYEVFTADSAEAGLKIIADEKIDLVISDMRMPFMDGYDFLKLVKEKCPNTIRVILSGYSEETTIFKAILHDVAKIYILKPWDNTELLKRIAQLFETEDILKSRNLLNTINNIELPTIPSSYQCILSMIEKDYDITVITEEIEKDPAISSKLLHLANAAIYGLKTGSVKKAAIYIGLQSLKNLMFSMSIINADSTPLSENEYMERLWKHSVLTSKTLHIIYQEFLHKSIPEAAQSAGILHNIGEIVMLKNYKSAFYQLRNSSLNSNISIIDAEKTEYTVSHQELGGHLANWWGLPFQIVEVALFHHNPLDDQVIHTTLVDSVHIAQYYAWELLGEAECSPLYTEAFERNDINKQDFDTYISNFNFDE